MDCNGLGINAYVHELRENGMISRSQKALESK